MNLNLRNYLRRAPATTVFIVISLVVWAITALQSASIANSVYGSSLGEAWILWGPMVAGTEPFTDLGPLRALTAIFLHLDIVHVLLNCFLLLLLGQEIERFLGTPLYTLVFLTGGLASSATVLLLEPEVPTAGASGAIYALMVLLIAVHARRRDDLRAPIVLVAVNVVYTLISSGVSFWGHMGGLVAGLLMAWPVTAGRPGVRWAGTLVTLALALAGIAWRTVDL